MDGAGGGAGGARLRAAAADPARMHAWAVFDVHNAYADSMFQTALRSAHAAPDTALGSHILAFWSIAARNTGRPADAEAMTAAAPSGAQGRTTPRVEAMLLLPHGRARAHQNNPACWADLDQSQTPLQAADDHTDPEWVSWFDRSELLGALASTRLDLGRPDRAEATFVEAAALFPADRVRTQTCSSHGRPTLNGDRTSWHVPAPPPPRTRPHQRNQLTSISRTAPRPRPPDGSAGRGPGRARLPRPCHHDNHSLKPKRVAAPRASHCQCSNAVS
ncbi:hypothetical protein [Streptomyces scopuliridis]|uniref:hypothetical protein n=1 Tax=Streptomyces scopuliridis TaxID=452529 RepID=UPI0035E36914